METTRERARALLPQVLLTLLSMILALALETHWSHFQANTALWNGGWVAALAWLQAATILAGIVEIWLFYVSLILRFSWVPGVRDMSLPFLVGLLIFVLVDLQGADQVGPWLICLSILIGVAIAESHLIFRQARREPANAKFFESLKPATISDFKQQIALVFFIAMMGVFVEMTGNQSALAFVCLLIAAGATVAQIIDTRYFWNLSIHAEPEPQPSTEQKS